MKVYNKKKEMNFAGLNINDNILMAFVVIAIIYSITLVTSCSRVSFKEGMELLKRKKESMDVHSIESL